MTSTSANTGGDIFILLVLCGIPRNPTNTSQSSTKITNSSALLTVAANARSKATRPQFVFTAQLATIASVFPKTSNA